ncbi:hypothetical protein CY0110_19852 [Crocosphaera chwakensis CCY0110]|uniref:Uncharacterized protein n=1 Tax=Crocosphaera chwakensis CCY0110 TaxID=391612 RepID=A3IJV2_9CHRO|nr:hypothetical protein CY0110_19852 [Crocosphaera chwakensis CCY0110]
MVELGMTIAVNFYANFILIF